MSTSSSLVRPRPSVALTPLAIVFSGLLALYVPSFIDLFSGPWASEKNAHGPIVMGVTFVLLYFRIRQLLALNLLERNPQPLAGTLIFVFGLLCYVLGRSQSVLILEVGSLILVLIGIVMAAFGRRTCSRMWFPFFFMLFMIPLPPSIVDAVTLPMKIAASYAAEHLLYWAGYPVGRSGVMLSIGQYQLLVADACAGLNSLFTLEAMGLLYMNLVRHQSVVRNAVLATLIVPISFAANSIRIVFLALITYHLGDAAGQGFLHSFSGLVLFLSALLLIMAVDGMLTWLVGTPPGEAPASPILPQGRGGDWQRMCVFGSRASMAMMVSMFVAAITSYWMTPTLSHIAEIGNLERGVPMAFGDWKLMPNRTIHAQLSIGNEGESMSGEIYDQVLMRTYVNANGDEMMLALAYAKEQRQEVKLHLPEICYPAQGYKVVILNKTVLNLAGVGQLPGMHMVAASSGRTEAVTYWTRVGRAYPIGGLAMRMQIFRDGLAGRVNDGILVRASSLIRDERDAPAAYALQQRFLSELVAATNAGPNALVVRY